MRMNSKILRAFIREVITEATSKEDIAAFYEDASDWGMKAITLYSPAVLEKNTDDIASGVLGYIAAQKPKDPCAGAWEIKMAGGRGYGGVLYPAMFAAVDGPLMPDRHSTTQSAEGGWGKQGGRQKKPLDNVAAKADQKATPDDTSDDCTVRKWKQNDKTQQWEGDPVLDFAYSPKGGEDALLGRLVAAHEKFVKKLEEKGVDVQSFLAQLSREGVNKFEMERLG